ncbi:Putative ATPase TraE [Staphylococcus aureus]|nr:transfer complex protein TraE [Staphylococcus aureus]CAA5691823.1 Putative ATPase TraE [Staphylococcus aureus]CAA5691969.1 Putative ATPase TraE [Staphylococcus aureus]CAA5692178.1 Putative ATPase TraE [Staphylococcus aureus]CAA5692371.1 Putative ATPase TraE [Staphylococcus aureus]
MAFLKKKKQEQVTNKIHNESFQKLTEVLDTDSVDSIYPFSWIEKKSHIETGENYIKNLLVVDYPQSVKGAYLSNLLKKNGNIQITKFIRPANIERMIDHLNNSIKNKTAEQMRTTDPKRNATIKREIESSKKQLDKFLDEKTGFMYMYMYITLNGDSYEKIQALEKDVKRTLTRLRLKTHTPTNAMRESFHTVLPLNRNFLSAFTQQNMDTATAGHFFMFDDSEIIDLTPNTSVFGINKNTDSLVAVDFNNKEKTLNKNMTIIGTSGVGKSTLNMRMILDNIKKSIRQFIIDPEDEFSYITKYYGGTVVNISTSSNIKINPFEIFSEEVFEKEDETDNETTSDVLTENNEHESQIDTLVRSKIGKLKTFFRVLKDEISQTEISVLSSTLRQLYQDKGFKGNAKLSDFKSEDYPTLTELYNKLKDLDPEKYEVLKDLTLIIEDYTMEHGTTTIFDGYTNIKLDNEIVTFNLKPLQTEKDVQSAAYLNIFSFLWDEITKDRTTETVLMTDELHFLATNEYSLDFYYQAYKRIRKYGGGAIASTQQIKDILRTSQEIGSAIIENSHTKLFFGMDNVGVDDVVDKLGLKFSDQEISHLTKKKKGEALLLYGTQRAFIRIDLDREETRLWNKELYETIYEEPADVEPNYVEQLGLTDIDLAELEEELRQAEMIYE